MNYRRGSVCWDHCSSQVIFNREGKVEGHRFFSIYYQVKNNNSVFFTNIIIVYLYTLRKCKSAVTSPMLGIN